MGKKKSLSKAEFLETIGSMGDEQFNDFVKEHNREVRDMVLWSQGEQHISRSAFRLVNDIMFRITNIEELEAWVDENPNDAQAAMNLEDLRFSLENDFQDLDGKVDALCAVIKLLQKDQDRYKFMAELFTKKGKGCANRANVIKERIGNILRTLNLDMAQGTYFKVKLGNPTYSLVVNDMEDDELQQLPEKYLKQKVSLDTAAVKADLENGEVIPWATLKPKQGIRIS